MTTPERDPTVFERVWDNPDTHFLFKSAVHKIMAIADIRPKLPLQFVVAPAEGADRTVRFEDINPLMAAKMHVVGHMIGRTLHRYLDDGQNMLHRVEGFNVPNHPHIVYAAGYRGEGAKFYDDGFADDVEILRTNSKAYVEHTENLAIEELLDKMPSHDPEELYLPAIIEA